MNNVTFLEMPGAVSTGPEPCPIGVKDIPSGSAGVQHCAGLWVSSGSGYTCLALR